MAHCGGNIVSCDVARPLQNAAPLLHATQTQEVFLKILRPGHKFVSDINVTHMAK